MTNWSDFWSCLIRSSSILAVLFFAITAQSSAQNNVDRYANTFQLDSPGFYSQVADTNVVPPRYPDPSDVLYKSMLVPGWGQIVNKQAWKVPIVYGLLAGLTGYSIYLTKKYHDYQAAYYNQNPDIEGNDMRFGSTPAYLEDANLSSLRDNRNFFRNRRDFIYITVGLAYGLNIIDAYIFAHLRTFDVSEDLSMRTRLKPNILAHSSPGVTLSVELFNKK